MLGLNKKYTILYKSKNLNYTLVTKEKNKKLIKNNFRDTNYFTKKFTNYWCGKWLLVNKRVILMVGLDEN